MRILCLVGLMTVLASSVAVADDQQALVTYKEATRLFKAGDYRAAIAKYERAYALSKHPNNLYYLGEAHRRLGEMRRSHQYYEQYAATLIAEKKQEFKAKMDKLRLGSACVLAVASVPGGASVRVDGEEKGRTPTDGAPLKVSVPGGKHTLVAELAGHERATQTVEAEFGEPQAVSFALKALPGPAVLRVESTVTDAGVVVDGRAVGTAPVKLELAPGSHRVVVSRPGHRPFAREVVVKVGEQLVVSAALEAIGPASSPFDPEAGTAAPRRRSTPWLVAAIAGGALAAGGLGLGAAYNAKYNDELEGSPALEGYRSKALAGYGLAAGFAATSVAALVIYYLSGDSRRSEARVAVTRRGLSIAF